MTSLTIRAADSALALEEVQRRLGPDALILSTRRRDGQVEITATADRGELGERAEPAPPVLKSFARQLMDELAGPDTTGAPDSRTPAGGMPRRVILIGPPGSGCSTLAGRLAADALRRPGTIRPRLIAPRRDTLSPPGQIAALARIIGLVPDRPLWFPGWPETVPPPHAEAPQIIDLSGLPGIERAQVAALAALPGAAVWLVLPTGLRADLITSHCIALTGLARATVLTRTDLVPPDPTELATADRFGMPVSLLSGGTGLLDALTPLRQGGAVTEEMHDDATQLQ